MTMDLSAPRFLRGLDELSRGDRALLLVLITMAIIALSLGIVFGAATALVRSGLVDIHPETGYRLMTSHGVTAFFYWLYFAQMAVLLAFSIVYLEQRSTIAWPAAAWAGVLAMIAGFHSSGAGIFAGSPLLYNGSPELVGDAHGPAFLFYLGYLLLAIGMLLISVSAIATPLRVLREGAAREWSTVTFATVAWAGLTIVTAFAAFDAFLPAALWTAGFGAAPSDHATGWHLLFHNLHYLPLMATVLVWYVAIETMTGVASIFGSRFSKRIFALYLIFVPPTSLYHMFLEPNLAVSVRVLGSLLSLLVGVPTVVVFLVMVISLEATARAGGARGLFGWLRHLPWRHPAMSAIGAAVINLALGGVFAFVLIQEKLAPLLSDTFFVPAYFHFLTVGTVTLSLLAMLTLMLPHLSGRRLWRPALLALIPWIVTGGLVLFAAAGIGAGLLGVPRRVLQVDYDGAAPRHWSWLMLVVGGGAAIMGSALLVYAYGLVCTLIGQTTRDAQVAPKFISIASSPLAIRSAGNAWTGPAAIVVLLLGMYGATTIVFAIMKNLPVIALGGAAH